MASPPSFPKWSRKRLPPIVGAIGFDGGSKPAIAFVIPPKPIEEAPGSNLCSYSVECWSYAKSGVKCGFAGFDAGNARYAEVVTSLWGSKTIEYDTADCDNYHAKIGTDAGNPLTLDYTTDVRIGDTGGDCATSCSVSNNHGETDDEAAHDHTLLSGELAGCMGLSIDPGPPTAGLFTDAGLMVDFFVLTYDEEDGRTDWSLDTDTTLHRVWSWNDTNPHANGDPGVLARHECVDGDSNPVDWTTTVENTYDVLFSDEITTDELLEFVTTTLADPTHSTSSSADASCQSCFELAADEISCNYTSVFVRIINTGTSFSAFHWQIATWAALLDPEDPCATDGDPTFENAFVTLAPGGTIDITLYPDTAGPSIIQQVVNITCEPV